MRAILRFYKGYVRVRLSGLSPERFFNLCKAAGLELWKVCFDGSFYEFYMYAEDYKACGPFAKKSKVRLRVIKKFGLPFFLHKNRKRKMWAAGFAAFFLILYAMSAFVWDIEYQGNVTYTDDMLEHYLETLDITCGIRKSRISCEGLEAELRNAFDGITWVSARLSGTRLYVHIKENEVPLKQVKQDDTPCDLVAAADGTITSIVVRSGVAMVKAGDTVEKGQLLVSGRIPITDDASEVVAEHLVSADADIYGQRVRAETKEISLWHSVTAKTGKVRKGLFLNLSGRVFVWMLPNIRETEWETITEERKLRLFGDFYLPVDYGLVTSSEVVTYEEKYRENQLNELAEQYKNEVSKTLAEKGVQILENNVRILVNGSSCRFEVQLLTEETMDERSIIN